MPDESKWSSFTKVPLKIGPSFTRERANELLDSVLRQKKDKTIFQSLFTAPSSGKPTMYSKGENNSAMDAAVDFSLDRFPEAASRIRNITTGVPLRNTDADYAYGNIRLGYTDPLTHERYSYPESYDSIAHEMSHAMGLKDRRDVHPNAYDVGNIAGLLVKNYGKDINLPYEAPLKKANMTKQGIGPTGTTKKVKK